MANPEPATSSAAASSATTQVGSVFVSNYPPYSFWNEDALADFHRVCQLPPRPGVAMGLYVHIPFCRKRCKFCYFKVYTDKNADQIGGYVDAVGRELAIYGALPAVVERPLDFLYFGGGTPSYISVPHLKNLVGHIRDELNWQDGTLREFAFEAEPGTLTRSKLEAIKEVGVTRLSLGVEHFDDTILAENGRAHVSKEIYRVLPWIQELGFRQLNIDLISGMVGERWETWKDTVAKTIEADPDSVTIYQMELPYNTVYSQRLLGKGEADSGEGVPRIADWQLKREWQQYAIDELCAHGYEVSSAYTLVKQGTREPFVYRDSLWHGTDLLAAGVSAFGHLSGVHYQNLSGWKPYLDAVESGGLPVGRAFATTERERFTRELILQLKLGKLPTAPLREKYGIDPIETFEPQLRQLQERGLLQVEGETVELTPTGLLQVDGLLPSFYEEKYQGARYT